MMKLVHFEEALRLRLDRQPFQPFVIEMEDGRRFEIRKKKDLAYWIGDEAMYGEPGNGWEWLNRDDVKQIVDLPPAPPPGSGSSGMSRESFEETLRTLMHRSPFQPFVIELATGERIEVDAPGSMAWNGGAAACITAAGEPVFFQFEDVGQILPQEAGIAP